MNTKRRKADHPLYRTWRGMKERCYTVSCRCYCNYGGKGVIMDDRWLRDFWAFAEYMGDRPEGHSVDRIDPMGNYEPGNVRWATVKQQGRNTTANVITMEHARALRRLHRDGWGPKPLACLLYTSPSPRDQRGSRMPSSA